MKKFWKGLLIALAVLVGLILCYVAYVLIAYHRIPDDQFLRLILLRIGIGHHMQANQLF